MGFRNSSNAVTSVSKSEVDELEVDGANEKVYKTLVDPLVKILSGGVVPSLSLVPDSDLAVHWFFSALENKESTESPETKKGSKQRQYDLENAGTSEEKETEEEEEVWRRCRFMKPTNEVYKFSHLESLEDQNNQVVKNYLSRKIL